MTIELHPKVNWSPWCPDAWPIIEVGPEANRPEAARVRQPKEQIDRAKRILTQGARDGDYLIVPPEVRDIVDTEIQRLRLQEGIVTSPATQLELLADATLRHHCGGREVACARSAQGVIVLAVGLDEVNAFLAAIPPDQRRGIVIEYP